MLKSRHRLLPYSDAMRRVELAMPTVISRRPSTVLYIFTISVPKYQPKPQIPFFRFDWSISDILTAPFSSALSFTKRNVCSNTQYRDRRSGAHDASFAPFAQESVSIAKGVKGSRTMPGQHLCKFRAVHYAAATYEFRERCRGISIEVGAW